jgi:hypothetical protein
MRSLACSSSVVAFGCDIMFHDIGALPPVAGEGQSPKTSLRRIACSLFRRWGSVSQGYNWRQAFRIFWSGEQCGQMVLSPRVKAQLVGRISVSSRPFSIHRGYCKRANSGPILATNKSIKNPPHPSELSICMGEGFARCCAAGEFARILPHTRGRDGRFFDGWTRQTIRAQLMPRNQSAYMLP